MYYSKYYIEGLWFTIVEEDKYITQVFIGDKFKLKGLEEETRLIKRTYLQILRYLRGDLKHFNIPIRLKGTSFQRKVWNELRQIPYGETRSYKDIARSIGNEKSYRAVGNANNKNPLLIIVPCHRVIGSDGELKGFASGLNLKQKFIEIERAHSKQD